jgi:hypothetical protein
LRKFFFTADRALGAPLDRAIAALRARALTMFGCVGARVTDARKPAWNRYFCHFRKKARALALVASTRRASARGANRQATTGGLAGAGYTLR